jgi:peroxiredoxin
MKKYIIICLILSFVSLSVNSKVQIVPKKGLSGYIIKGNIKDLKAGEVYLRPIYDKKCTDSAQVVNGQFVFKGHVDSPNKVILSTDDFSWETMLYLENNTITISGSTSNYIIKGSKLQTLYEQYKNSQKAFQNQFINLNSELLAAKTKGDQTAVVSINKRYDELQSKKDDAECKYIMSHPSSYLSADMIIPYISKEASTRNKISKLYNALSDNVKNSYFGKIIEKRMIERYGMVSYKAPSFTIPDINGKNISLSDYKGKWVLVDFWASWCVPCRRENPNVLKAYNKFHSKGLEVLSISNDTDRDAWMKAVKDDKLPWTQASDLKGTKSDVSLAYKVNVIPMNFLINPDGLVIASSLRGTQLEATLAEIFK